MAKGKTSKKKKRAGRKPIEPTDEIQEKICNALRAGNYIEAAAPYAGISKDTFYKWLRHGAEAKRKTPKAIIHQPFIKLADAVEKAMAEAEVRDVATIAKASSSQWQAAAWKLERKYPSRWGRKDRHEVTGKDGAPLEVQVWKIGSRKIKF
jgi:hypothetical protein